MGQGALTKVIGIAAVDSQKTAKITTIAPAIRFGKVVHRFTHARLGPHCEQALNAGSELDG